MSNHNPMTQRTDRPPRREGETAQEYLERLIMLENKKVEKELNAGAQAKSKQSAASSSTGTLGVPRKKERWDRRL